MPFPVGDAETGAFVASSKAFGIACSTTGTPLSGSMSTAEVARDMDVLRRMVGDKKLTYLGFSYGTYLGNVYANLFPDRVRAVVIDGVLDPLAWAGTTENAGIPQTQRLKSGEGASKALDEVLARCTAAGPEFCLLAGLGDPATVYAEIVASLKENPILVTDDEGNPLFEITYAVLISVAPVRPLRAGGLELGGPGPDLRPQPPEPDRRRPDRAPGGVRRAVPGPARPGPRGRPSPRPGGRTTTRSTRSRACCAPTGSTRPRAEDWVPASAAADAAAPGFGPLWTWASAPCASSTWTVRDEDAYTGPFTRRTAAPVLVVGNYWDPATNYDGAVAAAGLLPAEQPPVQRLVGPHGLRHVGVRDRRRGRLPADGPDARGRDGVHR